jgi:hypothetical protein
MRTALACALAAGAVIAGCGGSSTSAPVAAQDSATLRNDVSAVRAAAAASDPVGAHAAAARLRSDVERLLGQGRLSSTDARSILIGVGQVDSRISAQVHEPAAPVTTTASPAPTTAAPAPTTASPAPTPAPAASAHPHPTPKAPGHAGPKHGDKHGGD